MEISPDVLHKYGNILGFNENRFQHVVKKMTEIRVPSVQNSVWTRKFWRELNWEGKESEWAKETERLDAFLPSSLSSWCSDWPVRSLAVMELSRLSCWSVVASSLPPPPAPEHTDDELSTASPSASSTSLSIRSLDANTLPLVSTSGAWNSGEEN